MRTVVTLSVGFWGVGHSCPSSPPSFPPLLPLFLSCFFSIFLFFYNTFTFIIEVNSFSFFLSSPPLSSFPLLSFSEVYQNPARRLPVVQRLPTSSHKPLTGWDPESSLIVNQTRMKEKLHLPTNLFILTMNMYMRSHVLSRASRV